jgi:hypothetical protein
VTYEFENVPVEPLWSIENDRAAPTALVRARNLPEPAAGKKTGSGATASRTCLSSEVEMGDDLAAALRRIGMPAW